MVQRSDERWKPCPKRKTPPCEQRAGFSRKENFLLLSLIGSFPGRHHFLLEAFLHLFPLGELLRLQDSVNLTGGLDIKDRGLDLKVSKTAGNAMLSAVQSTASALTCTASSTCVESCSALLI